MLRLVFFGAAFVLSAVASPAVFAAPDDSHSDHAEEAGDSATEAPPAQRPGRHRRSKHTARFSGRVVAEENLRQEPLPPPSGHLVVATQGLKEEADVNIFNEDGSYNIDSLRQVDHILRCRRTEDEKAIDPRLLTLLSHVYDHFGKPLEIISGYRNQRKQSSHHFSGTASDIRISGVSPKKVRAFAETLDTGGMGIGIYPRSQFVHIDVRPAPSFRWVDYSPANSNASEKRPPRGWKRKKLQS
ncbi:MAG TPA: DUF882 domain-containing protein [Polyangia bacterium]|jgi:uncharacterized protein YcbK (DUF882 family)|nr:DUF882 domain-containing protein [Polyangia bacterium]